MKEDFRMFKIISLITAAVCAVLVLVFSAQVVETNMDTNYQIKQAAVSGTMTVRSDAGTYMQNFATITTYKKSDRLSLEGISVRFRDGSTARVAGTVQFRSPVSEVERKKVHTEFQSFNNVKEGMIRKAVNGTLKQTANLFGAEEVYSTRRSEFVELFRDQLIEGLYKTKAGNAVNTVVRDEDGTAMIIKPSVISMYGYEIVNIEIEDIDFDSKTDALIQARKDAEQQETLARAEAERAKQDALTAEERGKASVATAKYEALVIKEREVIEAEKKTAVQEQVTLQAIEQAKQIEAKGKAEAIKQAALVEAGLSPREQAEFDRDTAIGVAKAMSGVKFPNVMVFGGAGESGASPLNPFDAVGLESFKRMAQENPNHK
jgi:regulator of protease activity HflC (stomatin/prohibitin superfamily)